MDDRLAEKDDCNARMNLDVDNRRFRDSLRAKLFEKRKQVVKTATLQAVQCLMGQNFLQSCLQSFSVS